MIGRAGRGVTMARVARAALDEGERGHGSRADGRPRAPLGAVQGTAVKQETVAIRSRCGHPRCSIPRHPCRTGPNDLIAQLQKAAEQTGLFEPARRGKSLKSLIDHPFTEDETDALVTWCESAGQARARKVVLAVDNLEVNRNTVRKVHRRHWRAAGESARADAHFST